MVVMRTPGFRLASILSLLFLAIGAHGVDVRHGMAHDAAHESSAPVHQAGIGADDHAGNHPHPSVDSRLPGRNSSAYVAAIAPALPFIGIVVFSSAPIAADQPEPVPDRSGGPPPTLRAPPAIRS